MFKKIAGISQNDNADSATQLLKVLTSCEILLADGYYTKRHNKICKYIHWKICKEMKIKINENNCEHNPQPVTPNELQLFSMTKNSNWKVH